MSFRTDIAHEAYLNWKNYSGAVSELDGVRISSSSFRGLDVSRVEILSNEAADILCKPIGQYFTLELPADFSHHTDVFDNSVYVLRHILNECFQSPPASVLVAALGNCDITPDSLGSFAAESILVTRHLVERKISGFENLCSVCVSRPGVLGTSGIESAQQIKALCDLIKPDYVFVIDAFACTDQSRLCRTIQISDTGISPGSGVGNNREELSSSTLGVNVLSIGMPTVIDARSLGLYSFGDSFVTPRSIDSIVRDAARIIAMAVNLSLHSQFSMEDIVSLLN